MLKKEEQDLEGFTLKLQETIFDYFNLITKEYYMTIDKLNGDLDYVK